MGKLAIFFAFADTTYSRFFIQAPVLILACGFLAYVATSILVRLADLSAHSSDKRTRTKARRVHGLAEIFRDIEPSCRREYGSPLPRQLQFLGKLATLDIKERK